MTIHGMIQSGVYAHGCVTVRLERDAYAIDNLAFIPEWDVTVELDF